MLAVLKEDEGLSVGSSAGVSSLVVVGIISLQGEAESFSLLTLSLQWLIVLRC